MNRKDPYTTVRNAMGAVGTRRVLGLGGLVIVSGLVGAAIALTLLASTDPVNQIKPVSVQSKDGSVVGTSVLVNESICNQNTPVASITIDGETIELFITQTNK
jgi:hypothetical protein